MVIQVLEQRAIGEGRISRCDERCVTNLSEETTYSTKSLRAEHEDTGDEASYQTSKFDLEDKTERGEVVKIVTTQEQNVRYS